LWWWVDITGGVLVRDGISIEVSRVDEGAMIDAGKAAMGRRAADEAAINQ
jgi:hypothetical protein